MARHAQRPHGPRSVFRRLGGDRGSAALEAALVAPVLIAATLLVVYFGRISQADTVVQRAASEGARAASLRQHPADAVEDAQSVVDANLADGGVTCETLTVEVDTGRFTAGGRVVVDVTCVASMADVAFLGVPGTRTFTAHEVEIIDRHRATDSGGVEISEGFDP